MWSVFNVGLHRVNGGTVLRLWNVHSSVSGLCKCGELTQTHPRDLHLHPPTLTVMWWVKPSILEETCTYVGYTLTLFFSWKTLPLFSRKRATSTWPFSAALKVEWSPTAQEVRQIQWILFSKESVNTCNYTTQGEGLKKRVQFANMHCALGNKPRINRYWQFRKLPKNKESTQKHH